MPQTAEHVVNALVDGADVLLADIKVGSEPGNRQDRLFHLLHARLFQRVHELTRAEDHTALTVHHRLIRLYGSHQRECAGLGAATSTVRASITLIHRSEQRRKLGGDRQLNGVTHALAQQAVAG